MIAPSRMLRNPIAIGWLFLVALISRAFIGDSAADAQTVDRQSRRPNIVLIVVDDLGYGEPGCYGGREVPTPNIDALASSGVRFTSGYVTAPFCAASRAALLSGLYQTRFGFEFNPIGAKNAAPGVGLPIQVLTIANRMRDAGYATGLVGKWHLGGTAPFHPQRRGFDEFFGFLHEGHYYVQPPWSGTTTWLRRKALPDGGRGRWTSSDGRILWSTHLGTNEPEYDADNPLLRGSQPVDESSYLTSAFTREACDFISRHKQQPFFLYLAFNAVHSPMQAMESYLERMEHIKDMHRRIFAAMLAQLDDGIGQVLGRLRDDGLAENTLVVFMSDNGGPTKELTSSNLPLRGGKGELYEGGIRVPMLLAGPSVAGAGREVAAPINSLDIAATLLDAAGIHLPADQLDGSSLAPLLRGDDWQPAEALYWRVGKKKAIRAGRWKMIRDGDAAWQLFNLDDDLGETRDLSSSKVETIRQMERLWESWNERQVPAIWQ